jgi:predicted transcriptional regulator of viral defense system
MKIDAFFFTHPVFRYDEFFTWKEKQGTKSVRAVHNALQYYLKSGRLLNIRRGLYAVVPPSETIESIFIDPYLIATTAAADSILAYHTALELHGVAYTLFDRFTFLTNNKIKSFVFQDHWFQASTVPTKLRNKHNNFGVDSVYRQELLVKVTTLERTFVDVLDRLEQSGGWEEVIRSISKMVSLNIEKVIEYCLILKNSNLIAKVGFFLEQRKGAFAVKEDLLELLLKYKPLTPQSLTRSKESGQLVKKWNLILPVSVIKQSWDEPTYDV